MTGSKVRFFPASPMRNLSILGFVTDTLCGSATGVVIMAVVQEMMLYCGRSCMHPVPPTPVAYRKEPTGQKFSEQ